MPCRFEPAYSRLADRRQVWRCVNVDPACDCPCPRLWIGERPGHAKCPALGEILLNAPPPPRVTFAALPCPHRGELLGTIDGGCGCGDREPVAACALYVACTVEAVAGNANWRALGLKARPAACSICKARPSGKEAV